MEDLEPAAVAAPGFAATAPGFAGTALDLVAAPEDDAADTVDGGGNVEDAERSDLSPTPAPVEDDAADAVEAEEVGAVAAAVAAKVGSFVDENMFFDMFDMVCMRDG